MGFVPNSTRTMAHMGQLPFVFSALFGTVMGGDAKAILAGMLDVMPEQTDAHENLPPELLQLIALLVRFERRLSLLSGPHGPQLRTSKCCARTAGAQDLHKC